MRAQELDTVRHHCTVLYCTLEDEKLYIEELKFRNCQHYYKSMELHRARYHKNYRIIAKNVTLHFCVLEELWKTFSLLIVIACGKKERYHILL